MPYTMKHVSGGYQVRGPSGVHAKRTSKRKAKAQIALLQAKEHNPNWKPTGKKARKYT